MKTIIQDINHQLLKLFESEFILELAITIFSHTLGFLRMISEVFQFICKSMEIMLLYQEASFFIIYDTRDTTLCCGNTRKMMLHSFQ